MVVRDMGHVEWRFQGGLKRLSSTSIRMLTLPTMAKEILVADCEDDPGLCNVYVLTAQESVGFPYCNLVQCTPNYGRCIEM